MNFYELNKIIHLAKTQNLQKSAGELNITAGALSKTLKKIETKLNVSLFERIGRNIQLNAHGKKFIQYAVSLVHEYEQMCSEFNDRKVTQLVDITGPSVLLNHCLNTLLTSLGGTNMAVNINNSYEGEALALLKKSQTHIAIVTDDAIANHSALDIKQVPLGHTTFKIVAAKQHTLYLKQLKSKVFIKDLLQHSFVCPKSSPFCGISRGIGSDGWPDLKHPRNIAYRSDDFNTLLSLVKHGHAIAYVPDITIEGNDLAVINIEDFNNEYQEPYSLLYKPSQAYGWLNRLVDDLISHNRS